MKCLNGKHHSIILTLGTTYLYVGIVFILKSGDSCSALINKSQGLVKTNVSKVANTTEGNKK